MERSTGRAVNAAEFDWTTASLSDFRLTQPAGRDNALGAVKFVMDNPYSIFLHDTPRRALFATDQRVFSSRCIRVEHPLDLANLLLDPATWTPHQPIRHCPSQSVILRRALVGRVALRTGCLRLRPRTTYGTRGPGEAGDLVACSPMNFEFAEFCASVTGAENQTMRLLPLQGKKSLSLPRAAPSLAPGNAWPGRKYPCGFWASHRQIPSHESCVNQRTSLIRRQIGLANRRADGVFRIDKITQPYFPALAQHHVRVPLVESVIRRHPTH